MNKEILNPEVQDFIFKNFEADPVVISLGKSPFPNISSRELAEQIGGRKKIKTKLPFWFNQKGIYYPPALNLEQTSSEITGRYKASIAKGRRLLDITGGSGIDTYLMREGFQEVHYAERNADLAEITRHNMGILKANNIHIHIGDALELLKNQGSNPTWDWIYLDPSRRKNDRSKVFMLADCEPALPDILPALFKAGRNILIKTSPMLDVTEGTRLLKSVREVHVVAVGNEVRELVWWLQEGFDHEPDRIAVDLKATLPPFRFRISEEYQATSDFDEPLAYLYEPNAALLKAGAFKMTGIQYGLKKIHLSTHLYTSDSLVDFPGRRFKILENLNYKPGKLPFKKANVSARNFPESVAAIRKRNRIQDGGDTYLFFVRTLGDALRVLVCQRL
ncbi:class I SAM-dependent methyltransferase [Robiginitalea aurantiaca]|uniref:Class I SAM-dependent methyltransferase n=1 Tax=Robiginitalea aurantiaca TaxID=3056915 RepID=A0ABT7WI51_9FLAO|nr:class I SAM-dependent methyltransferase [Robiginitalea aurantiaca]MDM9632587.1 class I SAM-dependent methyltransferase [Robiginitalea aurantiaca]